MVCVYIKAVGLFTFGKWWKVMKDRERERQRERLENGVRPGRVLGWGWRDDVWLRRSPEGKRWTNQGDREANSLTFQLSKPEHKLQDAKQSGCSLVRVKSHGCLDWLHFQALSERLIWWWTGLKRDCRTLHCPAKRHKHWRIQGIRNRKKNCFTNSLCFEIARHRVNSLIYRAGRADQLFLLADRSDCGHWIRLHTAFCGRHSLDEHRSDAQLVN